ncbi:uncharacterized protein BCR38DRAFT_510246 [Pseudomassariella vexata]|uniref:Amidohydrolase-related domain-containing protein n=1 Tax=Pseudomassariella vexata TaxID=1141098 RepID=A0A1Y2E770_9PEZI|nr:uncharacterized protein BCR38DRAFT_510246 [Pseudomassariella vexata]ORY67401.1 hypothetical protein BCR38DRAFT_510246 [Pseudomassariella vexata]
MLLQGGTLLIHDEKKNVVPTVSDLLPGFIDTHCHLWQTQYKGVHANHTLIGYLPPGKHVAGFCSTDHLFWGQLSGALESIDAGTTTVVDHASCNTSPDHPQVAIQALLPAGLRSIYCHMPARRAISTSSWNLEDDTFSGQTISDFPAITRTSPFDKELVHMCFAMDKIYTPAEMLKPYYASLRDPTKERAKLVTTLAAGWPMGGNGSTAIKLLNSHGFLAPDILLSTAIFHKMEMARYTNPLERSSRTCQTPNSRWVDSLSLCEKITMIRPASEWIVVFGGLPPRRGEVGNLKEGMKADMIVFDSTSAALLAAAVEDPVAAIVLHNNSSDIYMVTIDGLIKKEGGRLVDFVTAPAPNKPKSLIQPGTKLPWKGIAVKLLESRRALKERTVDVNFAAGADYSINKFHANRETMLRSQ